ncbi:hypothetical protein STTU_4543 [Streptomyces sp. Tu6071]|nr:hypothetical protein STTU_4543 [Streptomyces sp. Tu6071]
MPHAPPRAETRSPTGCVSWGFPGAGVRVGSLGVTGAWRGGRGRGCRYRAELGRRARRDEARGILPGSAGCGQVAGRGSRRRGRGDGRSGPGWCERGAALPVRGGGAAQAVRRRSGGGGGPGCRRRGDGKGPGRPEGTGGTRSQAAGA